MLLAERTMVHLLAIRALKDTDGGRAYGVPVKRAAWDLIDWMGMPEIHVTMYCEEGLTSFAPHSASSHHLDDLQKFLDQ